METTRSFCKNHDIYVLSKTEAKDELMKQLAEAENLELKKIIPKIIY
jgi:hypothetical protein